MVSIPDLIHDESTFMDWEREAESAVGMLEARCTLASVVQHPVQTQSTGFKDTLPRGTYRHRVHVQRWSAAGHRHRNVGALRAQVCYVEMTRPVRVHCSQAQRSYSQQKQDLRHLLHQLAY